MKKVLSVFLVVVMIVTALPLTTFNLTASAETYDGTCGENVTWLLDTDTGVLTISGSGDMDDYTNSAPWYSQNSYIKSVNIENGVTSIGYHAFGDCRRLTSVKIPESVTSIADDAFFDCRSLSVINVDSGNQSYSSEEGVLFNNDKTELICCPGGKSGEYSIPSSVTSIGEDAFSICSGLTSVTIPDTVTSIGYGAFYRCSSLTSVTIPDSVTSIGDWAFYNCSSLTAVTIPDSVTSIGEDAFYGTAYYKNEANWKDNVLFIGNHLIKAKNSIIASYTVPAGTKVIADYAFSDCSSLTTITIPNSVTSIGDYAFSDCSSLASVTIPDGVTSIGDSAFSWCSSLTSITIPDSVTSIGDWAFSRCSSLTSVTIPDSVTSIADHAFYDCSSLTSVTIPNSVTSIGDDAFGFCSSLASVTIPDGVTSIGDDAFYGCSSLKEVHITDIAKWCVIDFTNYGSNPLYYAHDLYINGSTVTDIEIPDSVTSICYGAFWGCSSLTSVTIPNSVTSIGDRAFYYCDSLTSVTIPNSVTSIGKYAFKGCYNLTIYGCSGSVTETYAKENEIKFVPITNEDCSHKNTTVHPAKASTCKVHGNGKYTTCNDCGKVISGSNKKLPLAGHKYTTKTTKATLTKNGSIIKKCSACGKVASTTVIYYPKTIKLAATTYTYTGKVITPAITVKGSNGKALRNGTDYTVSYASGRKSVGKYKVTVTFKGNYSGTKTFYFTVNPVKTTVSKLTAGKKSIKVNISKKSTQVTGYQIQYSTSKTFKSAKTVTLKSYKTTSVNLTKLSAKKTYYVRVRTYKTVGKTKYYSPWSTYKYTKTK